MRTANDGVCQYTLETLLQIRVALIRKKRDGDADEWDLNRLKAISREIKTRIPTI